MRLIKFFINAVFRLVGVELSIVDGSRVVMRRVGDRLLTETQADIKDLIASKSEIAELLEDEKLKNQKRSQQLAGLLGVLKAFPENTDNAIQLYEEINGQLAQDFLALCVSDFKSKGFFVEFGATNGLDLSNTHLLEKRFKWSGIVAEPGAIWQNDLTLNRTCHIERGAVWSESGIKLSFTEASVPELSTISMYKETDFHSRIGIEYDVATISLMDLLKKYNAPKRIDFMSVDTEGSEYEILSNLDFSEYSFSLVCIEHNFGPQREALNALMNSHGYKRILEEYSQFDDWYINSEIYNARFKN